MLMRCDVKFDISLQGRNLNTIIGRAAHIEFLKTDIFAKFIIFQDLRFANAEIAQRFKELVTHKNFTRRASEDRCIALSIIAERTKLTVEDVEYLLMKSLCSSIRRQVYCIEYNCRKDKTHIEHHRCIPLSIIAERTKLKVEDVEYLLMKSLCVIEHHRCIPLSIIAERTKLKVEDVEYLLMKSLCSSIRRQVYYIEVLPVFESEPFKRQDHWTLSLNIETLCGSKRQLLFVAVILAVSW
ncbi:hypothetical protein L2E82_45262 [Cichorium intybus]|uniref:Uncharacterized protein n=1 Tax=Cichorium intybus TaxID=13427 RepID=A0ACB8ZSD5_CICIN|nr:hypothetical protein L2E82_45262 [Cichorium intybus]